MFLSLNKIVKIKKNVFNVRKNSTNISSFRDLLKMLFTMFNVCISFCNDYKIMLFNYLIMSLYIIKTIRLLKKKVMMRVHHQIREKNRINKFS